MNKYDAATRYAKFKTGDLAYSEYGYTQHARSLVYFIMAVYEEDYLITLSPGHAELYLIKNFDLRYELYSRAFRIEDY